MGLNWSSLAPHRPLDLGDLLQFHVQRPQASGDELAARVMKGGIEIVAIVGPTGSGKSTELAHAASLLEDQFVVVPVLLDRVLDMRQVTEENVFRQVALRIVEVARVTLGIELSEALRPSHLYAPRDPLDLTPRPPARDTILSVMREVAQRSVQGRLALLLDGLEKCTPEGTAQIVRALLDVRDEARLVFVAPYSLVEGSGGHDLHVSGTHFHFIQAVPVRQDQGWDGSAGRQFLREIVQLRLGRGYLPVGFEQVLERAAELSGGLPRSFLQLVRASGSYAALNDREWPIHVDLIAAARDQGESLERLLEKGDVELLRDADGKSAREIPLTDRLRLLTNGILLEEKTSQGTVVHPAPLLEGLLIKSGAP